MPSFPHLVLLQTAFLHHLVPLFLEGDDDESNEDVDEEERKDDKVDDVEDGHLHPVAVARASVLLRHVYGVLQDPTTTEAQDMCVRGKSRSLNLVGLQVRFLDTAGVFELDCVHDCATMRAFTVHTVFAN